MTMANARTAVGRASRRTGCRETARIRKSVMRGRSRRSVLVEAVEGVVRRRAGLAQVDQDRLRALGIRVLDPELLALARRDELQLAADVRVGLQRAGLEGRAQLGDGLLLVADEQPELRRRVVHRLAEEVRDGDRRLDLDLVGLDVAREVR